MIHCLSAALAGKPEQIDWAAFAPQDWQRFVQAAHAHGVAPLLWYTLNDSGWPAAFPAQVRDALHMAFYRTTARNIVLYQELARILDASQGIPVVVLKGAALASTLYPHMGTRPMLDIDLLVPRQALRTMMQVMRLLDYHPVSVQHHLVFASDKSAQHTVVEIHWLPFYSAPRTPTYLIEWFWDQREPWQRDLTNMGVCQFRPTAHLLYLVAHFVSHHSSQHRLIWLYDLHLVINQYVGELDWDTLVLRAARANLEEPLRKILSILQMQYGTHISSQPFSEEPPAGDTELASLHVSAHSPTRDTNVWYALRSLDWPLRMYLAPLLIFPSPTYIKQRYSPQPGWMWPLYYCYRWFNVSRRVIPALIQQVCLER
jgi:hypothetical protein